RRPAQRLRATADQRAGPDRAERRRRHRRPRARARGLPPSPLASSPPSRLTQSSTSIDQRPAKAGLFSLARWNWLWHRKKSALGLVLRPHHIFQPEFSSCVAHFSLPRLLQAFLPCPFPMRSSRWTACRSACSNAAVAPVSALSSAP